MSYHQTSAATEEIAVHSPRLYGRTMVLISVLLLFAMLTPGYTRGRLLTVEQAAELLAVSPRFVRRLIFERRVPVHRLGRHVRLAEDDLVDLIEAGRTEALRIPRR